MKDSKLESELNIISKFFKRHEKRQNKDYKYYKNNKFIELHCSKKKNLKTKDIKKISFISMHDIINNNKD